MKKNSFLLFLTILFILNASSCFQSKPTESKNNIKVGDVVKLPYIFLGTTNENYAQLVRFSNQKNTAGIEQMLLNGQAFIVAEGTRARVTGASILNIEVSILEGKYVGLTGWISQELVTK